MFSVLVFNRVFTWYHFGATNCDIFWENTPSPSFSVDIENQVFFGHLWCVVTASNTLFEIGLAISHYNNLKFAYIFGGRGGGGGCLRIALNLLKCFLSLSKIHPGDSDNL